VPTRHERVHFPQRGYWKAVLLFVELELLQSDYVAGLFVARAEDDTVRAFLDLI
jgi:hypothetical protein